MQLLLTGYAPITRQLPYEWYNTPNIRVITLKDFRKFSRQAGFKVIKEAAVASRTQDRKGKIIKIFPDLLATYGIFLIGV
jgi:methionine biosynthesis protein MetW